MKYTIVLLAIGALASIAYFSTPAQSNLLVDSEVAQFEQFVLYNRKSYASVNEYTHRLSVFKNNLKIAAQLQKESPETTYGVTIFSDRTQEEFQQFLTLHKPATAASNGQKYIPKKTSKSLTQQTVDYSKFLTAPKDQGSCGSCWAFSAIAPIEASIAQQRNLKPDELFRLSEQQFVDCDPLSEGCNGGWMYYAYDYATNRALCYDNEYPYTGNDGVCNDFSCSQKTFELTGYFNISNANAKTDSCSDLEAAVSDQVVAVAIDATSFQFYSSGILSPSFFCNKNSLNHGVVIYGFEQTGVPKDSYWRVRNSWGPRWGESGNMRVKIGNTCGICQVAQMPIVKV